MADSSGDHDQLRFERLLLPHLGKLRELARTLARSRADAEDLVQETCLRAYEHFHTFRPGTDFRAWILRILRNAFISQYHRDKRTARALEAIRTAGPHVGACGGTAHTDAAGDALGAALAKLPGDDRITVLLAYREGYTYREIAEIMSCPTSAVMSRLSCARRKLRFELQARRRGPARRRPFPAKALPNPPWSKEASL